MDKQTDGGLTDRYINKLKLQHFKARLQIINYCSCIKKVLFYEQNKRCFVLWNQVDTSWFPLFSVMKFSSDWLRYNKSFLGTIYTFLALWPSFCFCCKTSWFLLARCRLFSQWVDKQCSLLEISQLLGIFFVFSRLHSMGVVASFTMVFLNIDLLCVIMMACILGIQL